MALLYSKGTRQFFPDGNIIKRNDWEKVFVVFFFSSSIELGLEGECVHGET